MDEQRPRVGIGVTVFKDGKVLMGKRKNAHGAGEYATPGGHLEFGESFEECAKRELREETGIEIQNIKFQLLANIKRYEGKQYIHIGLTADWKTGDPKVLEPEKCEGWQWYEIDNLPRPMFYSNELSLEAYKTGRNYFDS